MNVSFLAYNNGILNECIIVLIRKGIVMDDHYNTDNTYTTCIYMYVCVCDGVHIINDLWFFVGC